MLQRSWPRLLNHTSFVAAVEASSEYMVAGSLFRSHFGSSVPRGIPGAVAHVPRSPGWSPPLRQGSYGQGARAHALACACCALSGRWSRARASAVLAAPSGACGVWARPGGLAQAPCASANVCLGDSRHACAQREKRRRLADEPCVGGHREEEGSGALLGGPCRRGHPSHEATTSRRRGCAGHGVGLETFPVVALPDIGS